MFKRIMVPLDGSRESTRALKLAGGLARAYGAEVLLLRVVPPHPVSISSVTPESVGGPVATELALESARLKERKDAAAAGRYLQAKLRQLRAKGIKADRRVLVGLPGQSIIRAARNEGVDLIVMTSRGRGGFKRAILGSTSDEVVRKAGVPVLVVPQKKR